MRFRRLGRLALLLLGGALLAPAPSGAVSKAKTKEAKPPASKSAAGAAPSGPYAAGWTTAEVDHAADGCTEALVQGAWANTKAAQGVDSDAALTPAVRAQLQPQIDAFHDFCGCVVKEMAKSVSRKRYAEDEDEMSRQLDAIVKRGACKPPGQ